MQGLGPSLHPASGARGNKSRKDGRRKVSWPELSGPSRRHLPSVKIEGDLLITQEVVKEALAHNEEAQRLDLLTIDWSGSW